MGEEHRLRPEQQHARDRTLQRHRIELDRRRRRQDEGASFGIELAIGKAEGVAGKERSAARVPDRKMVARMAGGVEATQHTPAKIEHGFVAHLEYAFGRNRHQFAIRPLYLVGAVDRRRAGHQARRIDHVWCATRMHGKPRIGQLTHDLPGPAGVVEMDVGDDHEVHRRDIDLLGLQFVEQGRNRIIGTDIDEGGTAIFDDQMTGIEMGTMETRVDGADAVLEIHENSLWAGQSRMIAEPRPKRNAPTPQS